MIILTVISISLRLGASGAELAVKVSARATKNSKSLNSDLGKFAKGVARVGLATSVAFMRLSAFIVARVRDLVGLVGSFVMIIELIIIIIVVVCVSSYLVLFSDEDTVVSSRSSYSSSSSVSTVNDSSKPAGLSDESWNSSDVTGKKVVVFACNAILNPPNGTYLLYRQGETEVGYADCSTFVCAVLEGSLKKTFAGLDAPNGYDFSINKKADLKSYKTTSSMQSTVNSKAVCIVGSTDTSMNFAKPGDILLKEGHVGIYVGVNENGQHVMVHASSHTDPHCNGDINLSDGQKLEVGFSEVSGTYKIIRTSTLVGLN